MIEFGLGELRKEGHAISIDARVAALMFQGMVREALYAKIVYQADRYRDRSPADLVKHLVAMFLRAVEIG